METDDIWITCHSNDNTFRIQCYRSYKIINEYNCINNSCIDIDTFLKMYELKFNESLSRSKIFAMKHIIKFTHVDQFTQLQPTKLMDFLLSVVKILKDESKTLAEIKKVINSSSSIYFEFGKYYLLLKI